MKKIIYRILLFNLFFIVVFCIKSYGATEFSYTLAGDVATITGYDGSNTDIVIPNEIDGHPVKSIGDHAFDGKRTNGINLENVTISEGITSIGDFAFYSCTNLKNVKLPDSVIDLGVQTFLLCENLTTVNIPKNLTKIQNHCFQETAISEIVIPENVKDMDTGCFQSCKNLKKVIIYSMDIEYYDTALLQPDQVIDEEPFKYCSEDLVIYAYPGSTSETYAQEHNITFKDISTLSQESTDIEIDDITLNKSTVSLKVGESETLIPTITPENATNKDLIWSSSNENVATVENGKITAKSVGTSVITVSNTDGTKQATCNVTVVSKEAVSESTFGGNTSNNISRHILDNTVTNKILPQTGINIIIIISIISIILITLVIYLKYNNYKDVK